MTPYLILLILIKVLQVQFFAPGEPREMPLIGVGLREQALDGLSKRGATEYRSASHIKPREEPFGARNRRGAQANRRDVQPRMASAPRGLRPEASLWAQRRLRSGE